MGLAGFGSSISFTLAHWMFAYKYWILSYKIPSMINQSIQTADLSFPRLVNVIMISLTFITSITTMGMFYGYDFGHLETTHGNNIIFYLLVLS